MSLYGFIDTWKAIYGPKRLCRVLDVPESSYFGWNDAGRDSTARRADAEAALVDQIRVFHEASDRTYGSPWIHADLVEAGVVVSERRVAELMSVHGIVGLTGREHSTVTTRRDRIEAPFPGLVERGFKPAAPDTVWYGDITYIWVGSQFWYLATVIDASSKMVIGWKLADHMRAELVVDALHAAIDRRGGLVPVGLMLHSDRGSQGTGAHQAPASARHRRRGRRDQRPPNRLHVRASLFVAHRRVRSGRSPARTRGSIGTGALSALVEHHRTDPPSEVGPPRRHGPPSRLGVCSPSRAWIRHTTRRGRRQRFVLHRARRMRRPRR